LTALTVMRTVCTVGFYLFCSLCSVGHNFSTNIIAYCVNTGARCKTLLKQDTYPKTTKPPTTSEACNYTIPICPARRQGTRSRTLPQARQSATFVNNGAIR
jgi:hypothetical protein